MQGRSQRSELEGTAASVLPPQPGPEVVQPWGNQAALAAIAAERGASRPGGLGAELLVGEVAGGARASDEFAEVAPR